MSFHALIHKLPGVRKQTRVSVAPTLRQAKRFPYGAFRFEMELPKGVMFSVQASSDLKSWVLIGQDEARISPVEYVDSQAFNFNHRFYRVAVGPILSTNVLGYASTTLAPGYSMIANPFGRGDNSVGEVLAGWPEGTTLNRFDPTLYRLKENRIDHGKWANPHETLAIGEGAIFFNPTSDYKSLSFAGEVVAGDMSMPLPAGFSLRSALGPRFGRLREDLGFPIADGDVIHLFDRDAQKYQIFEYESGKWSGESPMVSLCEAFWVAKTEGANWKYHLDIGV